MAFYVKLNDKSIKCVELHYYDRFDSGEKKLWIDVGVQEFDALAWGKFYEAENFTKKDFFPTESPTEYKDGDYSISVSVEDREINRVTDLKATSTSGEEETAGVLYPVFDTNSSNGFIALAHYIGDDLQDVVILLALVGDNLTFYSKTGQRVNVNFQDTYLQRLDIKNELEFGLKKWGGDIPVEDADPYINGGYNDEGGGFGLQIADSDIIQPPKIETVFNQTGYIGLLRIYEPTIDELISLTSFLFSTSWDDIKSKFFANPSEMLVSLAMYPFAPKTKDAETVKFAGKDTGVSMKPCKYLYETLDFGEIDVEPFYNAKWDYAPHTSIQIFLPYIGMKELDVDELMNKVVGLKYTVDILTGACVASISVRERESNTGNVLYQFNGNLGSQIPISSRDFSQLIQSLIGGAFNIIGGTAAGAIGGGAFGGLAGAVAGGVAGAVGGMTNQLGNVLTSKPQVQRSGNIASNNGFLGVQEPYLLFKIPRQNYARDYGMQYGYPSNQYAIIGELRGFTQIKAVHLEDINATRDELEEIDTLLKEGVLL